MMFAASNNLIHLGAVIGVQFGLTAPPTAPPAPPPPPVVVPAEVIEVCPEATAEDGSCVPFTFYAEPPTLPPIEGAGCPEVTAEDGSCVPFTFYD